MLHLIALSEADLSKISGGGCEQGGSGFYYINTETGEVLVNAENNKNLQKHLEQGNWTQLPCPNEG